MKKLLYITAVVLIVILSSTAEGHIGTLSTSPTDGQVFDTSPDSVTVSYGVDVRLTSIELIANGEEVELDYPLNYAPAKEFIIPLPQLEKGNYKFSWTIMGPDSHKMSDTIQFKVRPVEE